MVWTSLPLWLEFVLLGMIGAFASYLVKQIGNDVREWKIALPRVEENNFYPGILAYIFLGAVAGWLVPTMMGSDSASALFGGFTFSEVFDILGKKKSFV